MPKARPQKLQHSRLPWQCFYNYQPEFGSNEFHIVFEGVKRYQKWPNTYPEAEADARLMAASPYLLRAAQKLLWHAKKHPSKVDYTALANACMEMEKAIKRATERPEGEEEPR